MSQLSTVMSSSCTKISLRAWWLSIDTWPKRDFMCQWISIIQGYSSFLSHVCPQSVSHSVAEEKNYVSMKPLMFVRVAIVECSNSLSIRPRMLAWSLRATMKDLYQALTLIVHWFVQPLWHCMSSWGMQGFGNKARKDTWMSSRTNGV